MKKIYCQLEDAVVELKRRWRDPLLVSKVKKFLGDECPIILLGNGTLGNGFLARHIATCRLEDSQFIQRCQEVGLRPTFLEYTTDKFVSCNPSKVRLGRLKIIGWQGKNGGNQIITLPIIDLPRWEGMSFSLIATRWGESLVDFHHRFSSQILGDVEIIDISTWLNQCGGRAVLYYPHLLAATGLLGILFESFESPGFPELDEFTEKVVKPAWEWVTNQFGVPPLIVYHPLASGPEEEREILERYPNQIITHLPVQAKKYFSPGIRQKLIENGLI